MFQNITSEKEQEQENIENDDVNSGANMHHYKFLFSIQNIIIYIVSFMVSMVSFNGELAPFGLAMFASTCSNRNTSRNCICYVFSWNNYKIWISEEHLHILLQL